MLRQLEDYFLETSVHGCRYFGSRRTSAPLRACWAIAVTMAFLGAGYMVMSSLQEVSRNPIVTSFESVPVQELQFPAVSVDPGKLSHWHRFPAEVLNMIEFDCTGGEGEACLRRRLPVMERYRPFLTDFVRKILRVSLTETDQAFEYVPLHRVPYLPVVQKAALQDVLMDTVEEFVFRYSCNL